MKIFKQWNILRTMRKKDMFNKQIIQMLKTRYSKEGQRNSCYDDQKIYRAGRICSVSWRMDEIWKDGKDRLSYPRQNKMFKQKYGVKTSMYMCVNMCGSFQKINEIRDKIKALKIKTCNIQSYFFIVFPL